ncbi:MAG: hypothetical protein OHK93_005018 [Ramalina farinacea]|uniref:Uncharacterized protein n=1 Tax=Ramalina farinacea TaxID=258253 RepID=A0AA43U0W0_9LECA|nr:hypothetical protein [Ramalina farinacea]
MYLDGSMGLLFAGSGIPEAAAAAESVNLHLDQSALGALVPSLSVADFQMLAESVLALGVGYTNNLEGLGAETMRYFHVYFLKHNESFHQSLATASAQGQDLRPAIVQGGLFKDWLVHDPQLDRARALARMSYLHQAREVLAQWFNDRSRTLLTSQTWLTSWALDNRVAAWADEHRETALLIGGTLVVTVMALYHLQPRFQKSRLQRQAALAQPAVAAEQTGSDPDHSTTPPPPPPPPPPPGSSEEVGRDPGAGDGQPSDSSPAPARSLSNSTPKRSCSWTDRLRPITQKKRKAEHNDGPSDAHVCRKRAKRPVRRK